MPICPMKFEFFFTNNFERKIKRLAKKIPFRKNDLDSPVKWV